MREGVRRGDGDRTNVVNPDWYLGVFGGYARNEGRSDGFGSSLILDGGYFGVNAQTQRGAWFANFVGSFGFHDLGTVRRDLTGLTFRVGFCFFKGKSQAASDRGEGRGPMTGPKKTGRLMTFVLSPSP